MDFSLFVVSGGVLQASGLLGTHWKDEEKLKVLSALQDLRVTMEHPGSGCRTPVRQQGALFPSTVTHF